MHTNLSRLSQRLNDPGLVWGFGGHLGHPPETPKFQKTHNFGQFSHEIIPYIPEIGLCTLFTACRTLPNPFFNKICPSKSILKPYEKKFFQGPRGRQALQTLPPPGGGRHFDPILPKTKKAGRHPPPRGRVGSALSTSLGRILGGADP